jgi:hypothetical protein
MNNAFGTMTGEHPPIIVTITARRNARRYRVEYDGAGQPRCVLVYSLTGGINSHYGWRSIWNSDEDLDEGSRAHAAIRVAAQH